MNYKNRFYIPVTILTVFVISISSTELQNFKFDLQKLDYGQRDKLFSFLDLNKDSTLEPNEFNLLLRSLFVSTKMNKAYNIDQIIEQKLFDLMDINHNKKIDKTEFNNIWDKWITVTLKPKSALIVVDMQNDFIADGGSMRIEDGVSIVPVINKLITSVNFDTVVYTFDWHPSNHCSFIENINLRPTMPPNEKTPKSTNAGNSVVYKEYPYLEQKLWPRHCVQNTEGAKLYKDLIIAKNSFNLFKGMNPDIDSYSAFFDNGRLHKSELSDTLLEKGITDVYVSGVAYEYCVGSTANDSLYLGFRTAFIEDAVHGIDQGSVLNMRNNLTKSYASLIKSDDVSDMVNGNDRKLEMGFVLAQKVFHRNQSDFIDR